MIRDRGDGGATPAALPDQHSLSAERVNDTDTPFASIENEPVNSSERHALQPPPEVIDNSENLEPTDEVQQHQEVIENITPYQQLDEGQPEGALEIGMALSLIHI